MAELKWFWARLEGWRTFIINGALALAMILLEVLSYLMVIDWKELVTPQQALWIAIAINVLNIVLRHVTRTVAPTKAITQGLMSKVKGIGGRR